MMLRLAIPALRLTPATVFAARAARAIPTAMKAGAVRRTDGRGHRAKVTVTDEKQSKGVIHVFDTVLLPAD